MMFTVQDTNQLKSDGQKMSLQHDDKLILTTKSLDASTRICFIFIISNVISVCPDKLEFFGEFIGCVESGRCDVTALVQPTQLSAVWCKRRPEHGTTTSELWRDFLNEENKNKKFMNIPFKNNVSHTLLFATEVHFLTAFSLFSKTQCPQYLPMFCLQWKRNHLIPKTSSS